MTHRPNNLPSPARTQGHGGAKAAVVAYLAKNTTLLSGLLPPGMDERRMARIAIQIFREIPKLQTCSPASLIGGILAAAQVGLPLGKGAGGFAYLIPFGNEATFVVGVPGRIRLAYQSGHVKAARSGIVYSDQKFEVDPIKGDISIGMQDPEKDYESEPGAWYWAAVETDKGGVIVDYMNRPTVQARRNKLMSKNSPAWRDHFDEMAQNAVFRRLLKRVPKSESQVRAEIMDSRVIRHDDGSLVGEWVENGDDSEAVIDVTPEPAKETKPKSGPTITDKIEAHLDTELGMKATGDVAVELTAKFRAAKLIGKNASWHEIDAGKPWTEVREVLDSIKTK